MKQMQNRNRNRRFPNTPLYGKERAVRIPVDIWYFSIEKLKINKGDWLVLEYILLDIKYLIIYR